MPVDASIYGQLQQPRPVNRLAELAQAMQIQGLQQQGELGQLKMDEYRRGVERTNRLQSLLAQDYGAPEAREEALVRGGYIEEAAKLGKDRREGVKLDEETAKNRQERALSRIKLYRDAALGVADPAGAAELIQSMLTDPDLKGTPVVRIPAEQWLPKGTDAASFEDWRKQFALGATKFIEMNKPQITTQNLGGTSRMVATPGLGGAPQVLSDTPITQSPDNAASVAATIRGQNLTDARARERLEFDRSQPRGQFIETTNGFVLADPRNPGNVQPVMGPDGKPLKGKAADRSLNETQAKANLFGSRMKEADRIITDLEGKYWPGAVNAKMAAGEVPVVGGAAGWLGNVMLTQEGQQAEQAQRDFINAVLRRESGAVISPQEFANGQKQYFPQPGDTKEVLEQKRRNRALAIKGLEAEVPGGFRTTPTLTSPGAGGGDADPADPLGIRGKK